MTWQPDYCTSAELKAFIRIGDTDDDAQVALWVTAASRAVDRACGRQFGQVASVQARYYTPFWYQPTAQRGHWLVEIDDVQDATGLAVAYDATDDQTYATAITEYLTTPLNAAANDKPWTGLRFGSTVLLRCPRVDSVRVTALYGWSSVPATIKEATLLQGSRFASRRDSPFGVAGSPTDGSEMRLLAKLDPDVALMVKSYIRWWGAR